MKTVKGKITKQISNDYTVEVDDNFIICKARGKFRNQNITPLVGDNVIIDQTNQYILKVQPRKNQLERPKIANIDQAIIITSLKKPDFDSNLLDKLLVIIEFNNIKPIIIFTKIDLLTKEEKQKFQKYFDYYAKIGYDIYFNNEITKIKKIFTNKVSVFTGQSGAGKSTLLNKLDQTLNLKTAEISEALNRGKHTTRYTSLIKINDGLVADTPGFSAISFNAMTQSDIRDNFIEFNQYRQNCQYRNCMHNKEDNCQIKDKVNSGEILTSRYHNYLKFIKE